MRLIPRTIVGRTVLVLLIGLTVSHLISVGIYSGDRRLASTVAGGQQVAERIAAIAQVVENAPEPTRPQLVRSLWGPGFSVTWSSESLLGPESRDWQARVIRSALADYLEGVAPERIRVAYREAAAEMRWLSLYPEETWGDPWVAMQLHMGRTVAGQPSMPFPRQMGRVMQAWQSGQILEVSLQLSDGSWLNFATPAQRWQPFWRSQFFLSIVLMTGAVIILSVWAVRRSTVPLALFASAAERLGMDMDAPALDEEGPLEVQRAARAFNEMQRRLRTFIKDRTKMLAAISHDLRTPITRLRLRAEFVDDPEQQKKMLADLEQMEAMISATLSFARDDAADEPRKPFDLAVLLQDLCDDAADAGQSVAYEGKSKLTYTGRPLALKRVFSNLIDNAVKYGDGARVDLATTGDGVTVMVEDEGPGIPEDELDNVFAPFYRLERSRSRETGGVGLGLAAVRSIVRGHGGEVTLANRRDGGLRAEVNLPR